MADQLDEIVKVTITRQTSAPSMASFSEHLIATPAVSGAQTTKRVVKYGGLSELVDAGFPTTSFVYKAAQKQLSQSPHIGNFYVGVKESTEDWDVALQAMQDYNEEWYAVTTLTRIMAEQQTAAEWIQAAEKLGIMASGDPATVNEETGDLADWAKTNNLDRISVFYHPASALVVDAISPNDPFPEAAFFGKMLSKHPGSATWALKALQAVPTYSLKTGQRSTAFKKNANIYTSVAGLPTTSDGRVASGEYIDVIHGCDWLKARIQNMIFLPLSQMDKVSFTDTGIQTLVGQLRAALDEGVKYEILGSYDISAPTRDEVPVDMRAERTLPDVKFTGVLAGAIHRTIIEGTITL